METGMELSDQKTIPFLIWRHTLNC